jgi:tight adherence protein C
VITAAAVAVGSWVAAAGLAAWRWRLPPRIARVIGVRASGRHRAKYPRVLLVVLAAGLASVHVALGAATLVGPMVVARWRRLRARRLATARVASAMPELVDLVSAGIAAGCTARQALLSARGPAPDVLRPALDRLAPRLDRGERFADAAEHVAGELGEAAHPLAAALRAHERDGVPLRATLERIATDARRQRRQQAEARIRQLPVRLSVPLVTCTLSAFVLLTIVPLGAATFHSLQRDVPTHQEVLP